MTALSTGFLTLKMQAPQYVENLLLGPALRMIAILLRSNALVGDPTTGSLFSPNGPVYLQVKPKILDQPVFIAAASGGRELHPDRSH
jgi:hypothetical protein